jgi:hypothetical protein
MLSDREKRLVEHKLLMLSDSDLVRWAVSALESDESAATDPGIIELASLPDSQPRLCEPAERLLWSSVERANPEFDAASPDAEAYAQEAFLGLCSRLVSEDLQPYEFCRVISPIERAYDFPAWLDDFYNQCDWCEPESSRSDFRHLIEYAARYVEEHAA